MESVLEAVDNRVICLWRLIFQEKGEHQSLNQCPKITYIYNQVTKPSCGRRNYDSYLSGAKEEVR